KITMLGSDAKIKWRQTGKALTLNLPKKLPCEVAYGFKIEVNGKLDDATLKQTEDGVERVGDFPIFNSER
ncbi:MAG: hypothetical protein KAR47_15030, partial [Planctomycetes bacterium]|nr:hypothetical protein [Planctomycetota bacterium]